MKRYKAKHCELGHTGQIVTTRKTIIDYISIKARQIDKNTFGMEKA